MLLMVSAAAVLSPLAPFLWALSEADMMVAGTDVGRWPVCSRQGPKECSRYNLLMHVSRLFLLSLGTILYKIFQTFQNDNTI